MVELNIRGPSVRLCLVPILIGSTAVFYSCVPSAQLVLKGPVADECTSAGLKGCDEIAEGALLYADGKPDQGERKLARGLRANAGKAAELKKFADGLELVGKVPGASQYVAPLQPAVRLIQKIAKEEAERTVEETTEPRVAQSGLAREDSGSAASAPLFGPKAIAPITSTIAHREPLAIPRKPPSSNYFMVAGNVLAEQCRFVGTPKMLCFSEATDSAKIVSDIIVSSGCSSDVVVTSRLGIEPEWAVYVPAGRGADVHGAALPLRAGRTFTVGVAYKTDDPAPVLSRNSSRLIVA